MLEGADVVYYLVHMMWTGGDFVPVERRAAENARKACEAAGVRRIVYLGGIMPKEKRSRHMEGRAVVGDALREGSIQVIELQAAMIVGPGSAAFEVIRDLVNHLPLMITPKWVRRRSTPIALENVLTYMIAAADLAFEGNRILELAGPDVLTYQEIMEIYGEFVGKKPLVIPVPVLTPRLSSYWLYFVTSVPPTTAMSLVEGLSHDYIGDDREIRELVPQRLLPFRESVAVTLEAEKNHQTPHAGSRGPSHAATGTRATRSTRRSSAANMRPALPARPVQGAAAVWQGWRFLLVSPPLVAAPRVRLADRRPELPDGPTRS